MDRESQQRTREALRSLLAVVREGRPDWGDLMTAWIEDAALRGLLVLDDGHVRAEIPDGPQLGEIPNHVEDRIAELRRRHEADRRRLFADPEALHERVADQHEVAALKIVLEGGHAQSTAMHALGAEMVEVPLFLTFAANDLVAGAAPIANHSFRGVSRETLARMQPILEQHLARIHRADAWKLALQNAFFSLPMTAAKTPRAAVTAILDLLRVACEPPAVFRHALPKHLSAAERLMKQLRRPDGKGWRVVYGPKPGRGNVTPWGAARKFALAFGIDIGRQSEAKRDRTRERASRKSAEE
jgi:hypothetical protein